MSCKIGTIISQDQSKEALLLSDLGFDFIFIDLEHGYISDYSIASIIRSNENAKIFIRIRAITEAHIKHALDLGCHGIIAPRVESSEELNILTTYSHYPPEGNRSVGFGLSNKFGLEFNQNLENFKPIILAQIESTKGLSMAEEIISNDLIDGIFIGPYDLSLSMNIAGQFDHPDFIEAENKIHSLCQDNQKQVGTYFNTAAEANQSKNNYDLIAIGTDSNIMTRAYQNILEQIKSKS
jgi:2-keto-3-deoxy-L-rhamnonate aldolase RhmA